LRALRALGHAKQESLINRTLSLSFSEHVKNQDIYYVISSCGDNDFGRDLTWSYLKKQWKVFDEQLGKGQFLLPFTISCATRNFATTESANDIDKFFQENPCKAADRTIKQSLESIRTKSKWFQTSDQSVQNWLNKNFKI